MDTDATIIGLIKEAVREVVREEMTLQDQIGAEQIAERKAYEEIHLWRSYSVKEMAEFLPLTPKAIYDIPESQLRPHRLGASGGRKAFLGINVLMYMVGLEPVDVEAVAKRVRKEFIEEAGRRAHVPQQRAGKTRVL